MNRICQKDGRTIAFRSVRVFRDTARGIVRCAAAITEGPEPGVGGTREAVWRSDAEMMEDVLRLAPGMAYKSAFHGLPFAGAKVTVQLQPGADLTIAYAAVGEFVAGFGGRLVTTEDSGTNPEKMALMARTANGYVLGRPLDQGGSDDPSPLTALGVVESIRAVFQTAFGLDRLAGGSVFVKGAGHVGAAVVRLLAAEGAVVYVTDLFPERLEPFRSWPEVHIVAARPPVPVDIFCPAAGGGDIGTDFDLPVRAIVGAANNQLAFDEVADELHSRGILYVPDFCVNGGGLISVGAEFMHKSRDWAEQQSRGIGSRISDLLSRAMAERKPPLVVAYDLASANL